MGGIYCRVFSAAATKRQRRRETAGGEEWECVKWLRADARRRGTSTLGLAGV